MLTALTATLLSVNFSGGTPNDFAAALSEATKQSIVISQGQAKAIPKAQFETNDVSEMAKAIRTQTFLTIMPGNDLVISDQLLSKQLVSGRARGGAETLEIEGIAVETLRSRAGGDIPPPPPIPEALLPVNFVALPASAIKDGNITYKTEKADALQLQMLNGIVSKPVKVHWIYLDAPVFINVKDLPELDFMKWAAKAVGSRLVAGAKEYHFDLDAIEVRKRALATIQKEPAQPSRREDAAMAEKSKAFRIACLNALSPAQLAQALASPGGQTQIELNARNPLTRLAIQRVKDLEQYQQNLPADARGSRSAIGLMQRVDPSRSAMLTVDSRFGVQMEIPVLDQNGRPGGVVRL